MSNGSQLRPRIGVTTYVEVARWGQWHRPAALLPTSYLDAIRRGGGAPVLLPHSPDGPPQSQDEVEILLDGVDGLVLAGGADVDPMRYAGSPQSTIHSRPDRDDWEIRLLRSAVRRRLPMLGVCRGVQLLNAAMGGTLHPHLPDVVGHWHHQPAAAVFGSTQVRLLDGSRIESILGAEVTVPCYHHQAVDGVADGLVVVGRADDDTVEAVEMPEEPFVLGVQWHPEENVDDPRLFTALANVARGQPANC